jgi:amidase
MNELAHASLAELANRLESGATSSRDVVESCLARIAAHDPKIHAFVEVWQDDARRLADARDAERATGLVRGPLHGVPLHIGAIRCAFSNLLGSLALPPLLRLRW